MARKTAADLNLFDDDNNLKLTESESPKVTKSQTQKPKVTESESLELPKYLQLERKEVRLRLDQLDDLTAIARRLNRARNSKGERITENTLIRIAIDMLLQQAENLEGITESELCKSVSLGITE